MTSSDHVARLQEQWRHERPDLDVSPMGVIGRLHRLGDRLRTEVLKTYDHYDLSEGEFDVLASLRRQGPPYELAPGELARHTMVTTGAITKRLDRLESSGLVIRRENAADGRGRFVGLTEAGQRVIDAAFTEHMRNEARLVAALSPAKRAQLERLLADWLQQLE
ncbi:MarR family winged helix-turn-helix transcriptional regulator [Propionicimonas sp.]|uniref:MarR family winged helix-turn-helix transcriptional regulator n=1 Tax=Propionicimonas sp. TaxID=1955623 RepID=UPI0025F82406|nr:MarR family transcriptional regulator [Propionicimonas sp.]MCG2804670.1 MarR family transcriptional regulator [Propionicimonas sp.]